MKRAFTEGDKAHFFGGWNSDLNFKIYDVITWEKTNFNTHIAQYLKK